MELKRPRRQTALISLVPMVDVMLILLVFFMVTSTYLNLDMIPAVARSEDQSALPPRPADGPTAATLLIRLGPDGLAYVRGQALDMPGLTTLIRTRIADNPLTPVILLPSNRATTQDLVSVMDTATLAGATQLRLIRLEARE